MHFLHLFLYNEVNEEVLQKHGFGARAPGGEGQEYSEGETEVH